MNKSAVLLALLYKIKQQFNKTLASQKQEIDQHVSSELKEINTSLLKNKTELKAELNNIKADTASTIRAKLDATVEDIKALIQSEINKNNINNSTEKQALIAQLSDIQEQLSNTKKGKVDYDKTIRRLSDLVINAIGSNNDNVNRSELLKLQEDLKSLIPKPEPEIDIVSDGSIKISSAVINNKKVFSINTKIKGDNILLAGGGGGAKTFTTLKDAPNSYVGGSGKFVKVKATEDGLEFIAGSGGAVTWGDVVGTLSNQTDLQAALDTKVDENAGIVGATKTKITYDAKGLVTAGADATTADIADSVNKRYVTDANLTTIGNQSGTNTGDNATNSQYSGLISNATHTGEVTGATALTIANNAVITARIADNAVTNAKIAGAGTRDATTFYRGDGTFAAPAGSGDMVLASAQTNTGVKTFLDATLGLRNVANSITSFFTNTATVARTYTLKDASGTIAFTSDITGTNSGTNTGDQTITLTGGVTGSGTGSFAATVITNANLTGGVTSVGNAATVITNANLTGEVTSVGNAATVPNATVIGKVLTGYVSGAGTVATTDTILQAINKLNGNDATNANLTGVVTSTGNATAIANSAITNDMLANGAVANLTNTNSGDNATNTQYSGLVSNATHTGDATGATALTVVRINGVSMAGLATGILRNTTTTGVPSIAINSDLPVMSATVGGAVPTPPNNTTTFLRGDGTFAAPSAGAGDMILASSQTNSALKTFLNGTLGLRNIANTFTSLFSNAATVARTYTLKDADGTIAFTSDITGTNSGTNTGDNATNSQYSGLVSNATHTGDATGGTALTLATVNANVGTFGSATQVASATVNAKGLVTAISNTTIAVASTAVTDFTEAAQDAVGAMVDASLTYVDATPLLQRAALTGDVTASAGSNVTEIGTGVIVNADVAAGAAIALSKLGTTAANRAVTTNGSGNIGAAVTTSTEISYVNGVTSAIQTQIDGKAPLDAPTFTGTVTIPTPFTLGAVSVLPTGTELNFVDGVTSAIQTQLDGKTSSASPSSAKFFLEAVVSAGVPSITASYNITSITDAGVGLLTVTIGTDFSSASYAVLATVEKAATALTVAAARNVVIRSGTLAVGSFQLDCHDSTAVTNVVKDPDSWHCVGYGDQA